MLRPTPTYRRRPRLVLVRIALIGACALAVPMATAEGATATSAARARAPQTPPATALPPPKASIVVDAETGEVWSAHDPHERALVASTIKLLTALIAHDRLESDQLVGVSPRAASMPARKMSLHTGERWKARDLLRTVLLASANDSAVALAEKFGGGTTTGYAKVYAEEAERLGLRDDPKLVDPAGLDDEFSVQGGNLISAYDLAIVARAFLDVPELARIVRVPEYRFTGGDGDPHVVTNHNRFLDLYDGAIGMKTGATRRSGSSLVAAATRDGHTLIAVVINSPSTYQQATALLDRAFLAKATGREPISTLASGTTDAPTTTTATSTTVAASSTTGSASADTDAGRAAGAPEPASASTASDSTTLWAALACGAAALLLVVVLVYRRRVSRSTAGPR